MRRNEAAEHFFVARNQLHKKKEGMLATVQEDESGRRPAQVLHVFLSKKNMFRSCFLSTTHEVGTASAAQVACTHDVSLLLGAEVFEAQPKRVDREGGLALRTNPSGTGNATVRIRLGSPSPRRTTKKDWMNVGRVALDLASSERISL